MAKIHGESKLAIAGALTLALALAGVLLVKEPLRSSRPVGTGLEMKQTTGEQLVRARLWEDPLEAIQRGLKEIEGSSTRKNERSLYERVKPLRTTVEKRVDAGHRITILLVTTAGGPYVESSESRIRDRYALGAALSVACYVPEDEGNLSFLEWEPNGAIPAIPYEWYSQHATRVCDAAGEQADSIAVIWLPDEALHQGLLTTLTSLSQAVVCQSSHDGEREGCALSRGNPKLVHLNPTLQQSITFKIIGPRSSSAFRALLAEARRLYPEQREGVPIWPNKSGTIELYSPWTTAMKGLLSYGLFTETEGGGECPGYEDCEQEFHRRLARAGIQLAYDIGSDDALFEELVDELERRQVRLGWDAVILVGEWDSFYGRALPIEFRAAACARIAKLSESDLAKIQVPATVKSWCPTVSQAIDLQIRRPADYDSLALNVFRYSYLSGLDGEVPGDDKARAGRAAKQKTNESSKEARPEIAQLERPEGTSQFDYVRTLAARIRDEGEGARAIGILGTDPYDALLVLKALRPAFPNAIFFTVDVDARYLHASEYKWTRNMIVVSHHGLQLDKGLQRDIPPFRGSYQTSAYFATLRAVNHVICRRSENGEKNRASCPDGYRVAFAPEDQVYYTASPRLFEISRDGAVDLSVVKTEAVRTIHPPRPDLQPKDDGQGSGMVSLGGPAVGASAGIAFLIGMVVLWTQQRLWRWACRHRRGLFAVGFLAAAATAVFWVLGGAAALVGHHDTGEPFSWTNGTSIWPTEILRLVAAILCLVFFVKASRDLLVNEGRLADEFSFTVPRRSRVSPSTVWINLQRVYHPTPGAAITADQAWSWYREAGLPMQRVFRVLVMFLLYTGIMILLGTWIFDEDFIRPCRGLFSCRIDQVLTLSSISLTVFLNLFVFDAVLLCRRWIGWLGKAANEWSEVLRQKYVKDYGVDQHDQRAFEQLKGLACIDLIAQRTHVVNRLIRYPFIALLILIVARNNYFDLWSIPLVLIVVWTVNVLLALGGAFLLYQSADKAKRAVLSDLSRQLLQTWGCGKDHEFRAKQIQRITEEVESNQQGAFVPFYQQPAIESSLYGAVALLQYLYLG
jgi:hypothetical protein